MQNPYISRCVLGVLPVLGASTAFGALAEYRFDSGSQGAIGTDPGIIAGQFEAASTLDDSNNGATGGTPSNYSSEHARLTANRVIGASGTPGTVTSSITDGEFFQFQLEATSGNQLNLTQLKFSTNYYGTDAAVFASYFVRSSLDNFNANLGVTTDPVFDGIFAHQLQASSSGFVERIINLGPEFQNILGPVTFHLYMFDNNNSASRWVAVDNVVIDGTVTAIPEPGVAAVFLSGGLLALLRRRNR